MQGETDAKVLTTSPECPRTTQMETIQQDLKFNNLSPNEAINVA